MSETLLGMYVFEMIFFVLSSSYNLKLFYIPPGFIPFLSGTNSFCLQSVGYTETGNKLKQQRSNFKNSFTVLLFLRGQNILYHSEYFSITRSKIRDSNESGLKMTGKPFPGVAFSLCFLLWRFCLKIVLTFKVITHLFHLYMLSARRKRSVS